MAPPNGDVRSALPGSSFFSVTPRAGHVGQAEQPAEESLHLAETKTFRTSPACRLRTVQSVVMRAESHQRDDAAVFDAFLLVALRMTPPIIQQALDDSRSLAVDSRTLAGTGCDYAEHSESARSDEKAGSRGLRQPKSERKVRLSGDSTAQPPCYTR